MDTAKLKERIRHFVEAKDGGNVSQAARKAGLNPTYVRDLLRDDDPNPRASHLSKLADHFGCSMAYLLGETDLVHPAAIYGEMPDEARRYIELLATLSPRDRAVALRQLLPLAEGSEDPVAAASADSQPTKAEAKPGRTATGN